MARAGTLEPDSFINPSLPLYVEWPLLWIQSRVTVEGGRGADPLLAGRVLSALAGAAAVFVIGLAGGLVRRDLGAFRRRRPRPRARRRQPLPFRDP
jgi:hypothetical protein